MFKSYQTLPTRHPLFLTLAAIRKLPPTIIALPANSCAPRYLPPMRWIRAPDSGVPVKEAKLTTLNTIPILTPAFFKSLVRLDKVAGNRLWIPAAKRP